MAQHPTPMTDQPTGLTDRELLRSLNLPMYSERDDLFDSEFHAIYGWSPTEYVHRPEFFLLMDNALAARGWHSQLDRVLDPKLGNIYRYKADKGAESFGSFWKDSRNSATREVYEKVFNNKEIEG